MFANPRSCAPDSSPGQRVGHRWRSRYGPRRVHRTLNPCGQPRRNWIHTTAPKCRATPPNHRTRSGRLTMRRGRGQVAPRPTWTGRPHPLCSSQSVRAVKARRPTRRTPRLRRPGRLWHDCYINVTPHQGHETLQDWAAFRLTHLRSDDALSAHEDAIVQSVRTAAAARSCAIDDYVTTVGHHQFHEVASTSRMAPSEASLSPPSLG